MTHTYLLSMRCPYCNSVNTIVFNTVPRRGEGSLAILRCFNCNRISKS